MRNLAMLPTLMLTLGLPLMAHEGWNRDRHEDHRGNERRREIYRPCPPPPALRPYGDRDERPSRMEAWRWHERHERDRVHFESVRPVIVEPPPVVVASPRIHVWFSF